MPNGQAAQASPGVCQYQDLSRWYQTLSRPVSVPSLSQRNLGNCAINKTGAAVLGQTGPDGIDVEWGSLAWVLLSCWNEECKKCHKYIMLMTTIHSTTAWNNTAMDVHAATVTWHSKASSQPHVPKPIAFTGNGLTFWCFKVAKKQEPFNLNEW